MLLLACLLVSLLVNIVKSEDVFVDIAQGKLKGFTDTTVRYKKPFYNFKGIPYAEPRVGAEKFQVCTTFFHYCLNLEYIRL